MTTDASTQSLNGGHAIVECLHNEGVEYVFTVPGESYLSVMDGIRDSDRIQLITNRHEGGSCVMAEAYAKATRKPAVCMVSRGPGATHASIGIHLARYDSTPMVLLIGQVPRVARGRESGQEIDYSHFFGSMAKWVVEVNDRRWLPDAIARAFHVARTGRPGPVVVSLPRDLSEEMGEGPVSSYPVTRVHPDPDMVSTLVERIGAAEKPVVIVGSGIEYAHAWDELVQFSEKFQVPVVTGHGNMAAFPNAHGHYLGNLSLGRSHVHDAMGEADLVVAIGTRLHQHSTARFTLPRPDQPLIQIYPSEEMIGQNKRPDIGIAADIKLALGAALEHASPAPKPARQAWIDDYRAKQVAWSTPSERPTAHVSMERVMRDMKATLPENTIHAEDAGTFGLWIHRFLEFNAPDTFFGPTVGSMGFGVPGAIAAKLAYPERTVVAHCGDGGFMMTGTELATAVQFGVNTITVVYNNNALSTIRMHQETQFPYRPIGTDLVNPDFAAMANTYGALGLKVTSDDEFQPALKEAMKADKPALIEVLTDVEFISPIAQLAEVSAGKPGR